MRESEQKKSSTNSTKRYCLNCSKYNWAYGYCDNKESHFYQLGMRYDEECDAWVEDGANEKQV